MKIITNKILLSFLLISYCGSIVWGAERDLSGVELITREEWGANETWRYASQDKYKGILAYRILREKELEKLRETDFEAYQEQTRSNYETQIANDHLVNHYHEEYSIDEVNRQHNDNDLRASENIKNNKFKMIIHHTASSMSGIDTKQKALEVMQNIYKFHAFERGWGDVGYNFIIDPLGNIYEGRAGGDGVAGFHTKWNNVPSIGIALMGNFEIEQPTQKQIDALIKLLSSLAVNYKIDPNNKTIYHKDSKEAPYIKPYTNFTIAGHTDAGFTACPGKNLYSQFDYIRQQVLSNIDQIELIQNKKTIIKIPGMLYSNNNKIRIEGKFNYGETTNCRVLEDSNLSVFRCGVVDGKTVVILDKLSKNFSSGVKRILINTPKGEKEIVAILLWQEDLNGFISGLKDKYKKKNLLFSKSINDDKNNITRLNYKINQQEAKQFLEQKINVLLYELSRKYNKYNISCDGDCSFVINNKFYKNSNGTIHITDDKLFITLGENTFKADEIFVSSPNGVVTVSNYTRKSYVGIPWNSFRGMLIFKKDLIYNKENKQIIQKHAVINTLDFKDYMRGIVETNDQEHIEKNKAMALISKSYALFYMHPDNQHPNIQKGSSHNAIDDPDLFQKYVGAGLEITLNKRYQALEATKNQVILYNGSVPLLPYFSCSAGFTISAKEKRGWTDTPYLQSRLDISKCNDFDGHGVGLSGKGSERRAKQGFDYLRILDYYYEGIKVVNL